MEEVEGDVGGGKELAGVGDGEADVAHGESGEVGVTEGDVFCLEKVRGPFLGGRGSEERTAQMPRTMRWFQGLFGWGGTWSIVSAMRRMTSSALLSSSSGIRQSALALEVGEVTFISNKIQVFSRSGEARYSRRSFNLGIGS